MFRPLIVVAALAVAAAGAPRLKTPDPALPAGKWRVVFDNGVVQTCDIDRDGAASVTEPLRASPGKCKVLDAAVVITFDDDRIERWTKIDAGWTVEHWCPTAAYGMTPPVVGKARRE
jgi:hypothetical protein